MAGKGLAGPTHHDETGDAWGTLRMWVWGWPGPRITMKP